MIKKTRLSFSSLKIEDKKENKIHNQKTTHNYANEEHGKKTIKSSTYQYTQKKFGKNSRQRPFGIKNQYKIVNGKIPPVEKNVIRIIPLGGVEEIGKNMTAIEINDDIIVIDAGMHFLN